MFEDFAHKISFWDKPALTKEAAVYVFFVEENEIETPFYIGQTKDFERRMKEYVKGSRQSPTDFSVWVAATYLKNKNLHVVVRYKTSSTMIEAKERLKVEVALIKECVRSTKWLVNYLPSYNWKNAEEECPVHEQMIQDFCEVYTGKHL